ncbi:MAG: hypothetical protein AB7N91_11370 [Candidatus Tectimicrobiota bacterium]
MLRWLPENVSTFGGEIDGLFSLIFTVVLVSFVLTYGASIYALIRYRRSRNPRASYLPATTPRQYGWILGLGIVVFAIDIGLDHHAAAIWDKIKLERPPSDVQVRVIAKQFNWEVYYPGPDGQFDTADDLKIDGELHVPVHKPVHVTLTSKDVIHSFFLPTARLKQDAMPGRNIPLWFEITKPGEYPWPCAELCGFGHTGMQGKLFVHAAADYEAWRKKRWPDPIPVPPPAPPQMEPPKMEAPTAPEPVRIEPPKQEESKQESPMPEAPSQLEVPQPETPLQEAPKPEEVPAPQQETQPEEKKEG